MQMGWNYIQYNTGLLEVQSQYGLGGMPLAKGLEALTQGLMDGAVIVRIRAGCGAFGRFFGPFVAVNELDGDCVLWLPRVL